MNRAHANMHTNTHTNKIHLQSDFKDYTCTHTHIGFSVENIVNDRTYIHHMADAPSSSKQISTTIHARIHTLTLV